MADRASLIEQFGKLKATHKLAIGLLLVTLLAVGFYVFFYQDIESQIQEADLGKVQLTKKLAEYQTQLKTKHEFQEQIQHLYRKRQIALEKLPEDEEIPSLLQKIDGLGKIVGLQMSTFQRGEPVDSNFYSIIPVTMEMVGTYHQIATFFHYIGKLTRIVNVTNIRLTDPKQDNAGKVVVRAAVLATTYRYKTPTAAAGAPGAPARGAGGGKR